MSLSFAVKVVIFLALAFGSGLAGREYAWPVFSYFVEAREMTARDAHISKRSIVYRIPEKRALAFAFSQPVTKAKIIVNPAVSEEFRDQLAGFTYGLRLRWRDVEGNQLSQHDVYLQADSPDEVFASGAIFRFFRTRPELVAEQDHLMVESMTPAASLEIETFDVADGIIGIDVRMFQQFTYIGNQSLAAYRRLSESSRERLIQPSAFPDDLLTDQEKTELARNQWRSVGPVGLDGRDYTMLVLYEAVREDLIDQNAAGQEVAQ
ncbi:MAG: hypothetical protein AAGK17_10170 [Pseudomonadota bacterium]